LIKRFEVKWSSAEDLFEGPEMRTGGGAVEDAFGGRGHS